MSDHTHDDTGRRKAAFDRFTVYLSELLRLGRDYSRQAFETAMETAQTRLAAVGEFIAARGERLTEYLRRDLGPHLQEQAPHVRHLGHEAGQRLHPERLRDGTLASLATLLKSSGETLREWSQKADEAVIYGCGEITSAGTLTCLNCGHLIHLEATGQMSPCPACMSTRFRKRY